MAKSLPVFHTCSVKNSLDAMKASDKNKICCAGLTTKFSVDIDDCFKIAEPNSFRWDYFISTNLGELYLEVHEVSESHLSRIFNKAEWLKNKISTLKLPYTIGRPFLVAPTKGIPLHTYGDLSRRLALKKIIVIRKGDKISELF